MAITKDGPIIIEGNHKNHFELQEIANRQGYKNHPVFKKVLSETE